MGNEIIEKNNSELVIYESTDGNIKLDVNLEKETAWLSLEQMSKLFGRDKSVISRHIKHIFEEGELAKEKVVANFAITTKHGAIEGNRKVLRKKDYYNLDMIISIGFRVNSKTAIKFRTWANKLIKEYMVKGFTPNDDRFINGNRFDTRYFDELLERIKVILILN